MVRYLSSSDIGKVHMRHNCHEIPIPQCPQALSCLTRHSEMPCALKRMKCCAAITIITSTSTRPHFATSGHWMSFWPDECSVFVVCLNCK
jgi:hypothetical protein